MCKGTTLFRTGQESIRQFFKKSCGFLFFNTGGRCCDGFCCKKTDDINDCRRSIIKGNEVREVIEVIASLEVREVREVIDGCQAMVHIGNPADVVGRQVGGTGCADRQV